MRPDNALEATTTVTTQGQTPVQRTRRITARFGIDEELLRVWTPLLALLMVVLIMTIGNSSFLSAENITTLLVQASALLVMAIGPTFVILIGSMDISFSEIANWVSIVIAVTIASIGYLAFPLGILAGAVAGLLNGLLLVKGRIPSLVVTLGTLGLWSGMAFTLSGGPPVSLQSSRNMIDWITSTTFGLPNEAIIALVVLVIFYLIQRFTWFGRCLYAIGGGEEAARLSGVDVDRYKVMVFMLSGITAGISGMILAARIVAGSPVLSEGFLLYVLAAVLVGGTAISGGSGGVGRTLVGALIITVLRNGMNVIGVDVYAQQLVLGAMLIVAVILTIDRSKLESIK